MTTVVARPHPFDVATTLTRSSSGSLFGNTTADYANMVGPFGGITAATLLRAALRHPDRIGDPVSLTVNFAGTVADGPFEVIADPVRTNRNTQHWVLTSLQNGVVTTTATAVFGTRRSSWADTELVAPRVDDPDSIAPQQFPRGLAWVHNYEMRFVDGGIDGLATGEPAGSATTVWLRDVPPRPVDFAALTALADTFFPRVLLRLGRIVPVGTVSMTVYFHADADTLAGHGDQPVLGTARAKRFAHGFFDQSAELWTPAGALLATSHQMVYFKA
ncbi:acyl-CoA thioesterase [Nocardia jiangsuensis]|uniref:Acyl-CoA thioesterase n=1 Tax=Nocardia jiangsuensis TaxID=1691563 RepID=A0ABV8DP86_9NOCA